MSEVEVEHNEKRPKKFDKIKGVIKRTWKPFTIGVGLTIVAVIVTKRVTLRYVPTNSLRINKLVLKDNVLYFQTYARKQGPPSYVIRCVETGEIFTSQAEACRQLGIDPSRLSRHLNRHPGYETISGINWNRAAIAAPRSG